MATVINAIYHIMAAAIVLLIINNFLKTKKMQDAAMYVVIMIPLIDRILRFK
ncbi:MAG TPA: hypothetical protein PLI88_04870 [Bacillota bacterium]|nr:hypothetical protein [Bacillota bacterium]HOH10903.1 hypothetical protein [Bacillota bacterium]HOY89785.1 hypothetical protein [Bacillota bacterium]HPI01461.1 hypothetical protein [Bacillota bacterium]HPM64318.1 hypothetical protein [Bacillota bacterium]